MTENIPRGVLFALATTLVASTAGAASKLISSDVPVAMIVLAQYAICLLIALPWLIKELSSTFRGKSLNESVLKTSRPWTHIARGITGWLCFYAYYQALAYIPLVDAALLRNTGPLFVPLVVWLWLKKKVRKRVVMPMVLGFAGVMLILKPDMEGFKVWHLVGLASGLLLACSMVGTRTLATTEPSSRINFYYFSISFLCSVPVALANWQPVPLSALPYLLYIGASIWLTMWFYTRAYGYARASVIAPVNYSGVVFAGLIGWLLWSHIPDATALAGMSMIILAGILTVVINNHTHR
ncbi:EamA family transporter [Endozoicomonas sp. OPT23]|uniref:DMT family transporter n=1 Tax=Endozoicomonas sp. OPT23 TaxID=2072845 RepID=UPI00129BC476|nr:DMT family transporter [Endozoicomonas sp. OPT23]MRI33531.1 EamA family transporter [Endozoicomonas sp. OPT23]